MATPRRGGAAPGGQAARRRRRASSDDASLRRLGRVEPAERAGRRVVSGRPRRTPRSTRRARASSSPEPDTEVGKTVVAAAIAARSAATAERVAVFKPAVTGLDDCGDGPDHDASAAAAVRGGSGTQSDDEIAPYRFGPPISPHLAAELAGEEIDPARLLAAARAAAAGADALVCEGVGGLLVPLTPRYLVRDLAVDLGLPLVVAASPGLGTINHTLLTIEAARAAGLEVAARRPHALARSEPARRSPSRKARSRRSAAT